MKRFPLTALAQALLLSTALVFTACKDDDDDDQVTPTPAPTPAAVITFTTPTAGQVIRFNETLRVTGTIVTAESMHGYRLTIRNHEDQTQYFEYDGHGHGTNVTFNHQWVNILPDSTELDVELTTLLSHDTGEIAGKRIEVQTAP